jgi:Tol biopolymer transport system component
LNSVIELVKGGEDAVTWSPDGERLCFVGEWTNREYLYTVDSRSGRGLLRYDVGLDELSSPCYSPDGKAVAFSGVNAGVSDIYVFDIATGRLDRLTSTRAHDDAPAWSPDGTRIAFSSERGGQSDLYVVDVAGKESVKITDTLSVERHPDWSPDGRRLAYTSDAGGIYNIHVVDLATGNARALTDCIGGAFSPAWSPDGNRIAFSYYRHGNMNLYVMNVDAASGDRPPAREQTRAAEFEAFGTPSLQIEDRAFEDRFRLETLLPVLLTNPFSFSDLRGDHQIIGNVAPTDSNAGTTFVAEVSYLDLTRRVDLVATAFTRMSASDTVEESDSGGLLGLRFPFDHFRSLLLGYTDYEHARRDTEGPDSTERYAGLVLTLSHDNRIGRGVDVTGGCLYEAGIAHHDESIAGDVSFTSYHFEHARYAALTRDQILALRVRLDTSSGAEREAFDIADVVRGTEPNLHEKRNRFGATMEYRFPVARDVKAHVLGSYLMLKDVRGYAFADVGYVTDRGWGQPFDDIPGAQWHHGFGLGLRLDCFLFQKAPFKLITEMARVDNEWRTIAGLVIDFQF